MVGAWVADRVLASDQNSWSRDREKARRPTGPKCWIAHVVDVALGRVGALGLVVAADAEVVVGDPGQVVGEAERLIERERVVHLPVDEQVVARRLEAQRQGLRAGRAGPRSGWGCRTS